MFRKPNLIKIAPFLIYIETLLLLSYILIMSLLIFLPLNVDGIIFIVQDIKPSNDLVEFMRSHQMWGLILCLIVGFDFLLRFKIGGAFVPSEKNIELGRHHDIFVFKFAIFCMCAIFASSMIGNYAIDLNNSTWYNLNNTTFAYANSFAEKDGYQIIRGQTEFAKLDCDGEVTQVKVYEIASKAEKFMDMTCERGSYSYVFKFVDSQKNDMSTN